MPVRRTLTLAATAVVVVGLLASAAIEPGTATDTAIVAEPTATAAAQLTIVRRPGYVDLLGSTASAAHEQALLDAVHTQLGSGDTRSELRAGVVLPDGWPTSTLLLVGVVAATESATATLTGRSARLRAVTADPDALGGRLAALRAAGVDVREDVVTVERVASLDTLCRKHFAAAAAGTVDFALSSTGLRPASYPTLDRLVEFAHDCRGFGIAITGHTDASGDESWNRSLSRLRAAAVADYLVAAGVDRERLSVDGHGSAEPLADNGTPSGRSRNRRIELRLLSASL